MPDPSASILASATMINTVICIGIVVAATVFIKKLMKKNLFAFKPLDFELDVDRSWIVIFCLTVAHFFSSLYLIQGCNKVLEDKAVTTEKKREIWNSLTETNTSRLIFSNMEPRIIINKNGPLKFYNIQNNDLAGILSFAYIVLIFLSLTRLKYETRNKLIFHTTTALTLCVANWLIGSWWAISCSKLVL